MRARARARPYRVIGVQFESDLRELPRDILAFARLKDSVNSRDGTRDAGARWAHDRSGP
jgi:hypothetical protein